MLLVNSTLTFNAKLYDKDPNIDNTAALVNPLGVALTIARDGVTIATPSLSPSPTPTGIFTYKYIATVAGRYVGLWVFTLADGSTAPYTEVFDVQAADPGYLISLKDAKQHLRMSLTKTDKDDELLEWISATTRVVEDIVGICVPKTVTEVVSGLGTLSLTYTPVLSITSITPYYSYGAPYAPSYVKVTEEGIISLLYGGVFYGGTFTVVYSVGRKPIPSNVTQGGKIILKHLWETQRGASGNPYQSNVEPTTDVGAYAVPNRAIELLKPDRIGPSVG